jgi:hypothetical protein
VEKFCYAVTQFMARKLRESGVLRVCALGGGPGSELFAVCRQLMRSKYELPEVAADMPPPRVEFAACNLEPGWQPIFDWMVQQTGTILANHAVLLPAFLPESVGGAGAGVPPAPPAAVPGVETFVIRQRVGSDVRDLNAETHRQVDRLLLPRVLEHTCGNLQQAALLLGIARQTLRLKLRDLGLFLTRPREAEEGDPV